MAIYKPAALLTTVSMIAALVVFSPLSATALSPGVAFGAGDLSTWQTNGEVYGMASAAGKVVVGGSFTQISPPVGGAGAARTQAALAIFNAETGAPDTCQIAVSLTGGTPVVRSVVTSPDGKTIFIGGNFSNVGGTNIVRVAAIDPVSCTVKPLRVAGISSTVIGLVATNSTLYLAGTFTSVGGAPRTQFAAVNSTTGALLPWAPAITTLAGMAGQSGPVGRAIAVSSDGTKVAIGGDFFGVNSLDSHSIAVVDANAGTTNLANYPRGFIPDTSVTKTLWSDGTNFYVGNEGTGGGVFDGRLAVSWTSLSQLWRDNCLGATQGLVTFQNQLYIASHAHDCSSNGAFNNGVRNFFMAEGTSTPTIAQWFPSANDGIGEGIGPRALTVGTGSLTGKNYLWYGGEFTQVNGKKQQGLTRFGPDDNFVPPAPVVTAEALSSNAVQVRFRSVIDNDDTTIVYNVYRDGSALPIWTGSANSTWWQRPQVTFVDTAVTAGTTYSYRVSAFDGVNTGVLSAPVTAKAVTKSPDYPSQVIADGASIYWRMDEGFGPWAQNRSGNATTTGVDGLYHLFVPSGTTKPVGVTYGSPGALAGSTDTSATFDGTYGYLYNDEYLPAPTTYSIETWIKTSTTRGGKIVGYGNQMPDNGTNATNLSSSYDRMIYMDDAGRLYFGAYTGNTVTIASSTSYNDNSWHHIVATQGGDGMNLYVDGTRIGRNGNTAAQSYPGNWHVGGDNLNGWPNKPTSAFFAGQIDDVAIYPTVLTAAQEVNHFVLAGGTPAVVTGPTDRYGARVFADQASLYWRFDEAAGSSTAKDSSSAAQAPGTYNSGVQLTQPAAIATGSSASFDGSSSGFVAENATTSVAGSYSEEAWFKSSSNTGGKILGFENSGAAIGSNYDKQIYLTNSGAIVFGVYTGGVQSIQKSGSYNDDAWHHVVATQGPDGMKLYVDGIMAGSNATTTSQQFAGVWRAGGGNLQGWPDQPSSNFFTGSLDEVAVYDTVLDSATVSSHYQIGTGTTPPDTTAPSAPTGLTTSVAGTSVSLGFTASTDNVGVTGYSIYRDTTGGFVPSSANRIANISATNYTDTGLSSGTYYYRVTATDAAGNLSTPSETATAVVAPPPPVTVVVQPTADAMVYQVNPNTNYGADLQLSARGVVSNASIASYLKFLLPEAPAGRTLSAVSLQVRTSTDPTAGTSDTPQFSLVTGSWSESTITWNNRPTGAGSLLGTLSGATASNTVYYSAWDSAALLALQGSSISVALTSTGTDNIRLFSSNSSSSFAPVLSLTYL